MFDKYIFIIKLLETENRTGGTDKKIKNSYQMHINC